METKQKERIRRLMELLKKTDRIHLKEAARMLRDDHPSGSQPG